MSAIHAGDEIGHRHVEGAGDPYKRGEGGILQPPLKASPEVSIVAGSGGIFLLGQSGGLAHLADSLTKPLPNLIIHGRRDSEAIELGKAEQLERALFSYARASRSERVTALAPPLCGGRGGYSR